MRVFRFMSNEEFDKFRKGEVLKNNTKHIGRTNSVGFCFLNTEEFIPEKAFHFLTGVVCPEICVVLETETELKKTYGEYATPTEPKSLMDLFLHWNDSFRANEYCITSYSNKDFKLIKYAIPDWLNRDKWDWKESE